MKHVKLSPMKFMILKLSKLSLKLSGETFAGILIDAAIESQHEMCVHGLSTKLFTCVTKLSN